jgi:Vam6/Vps39-like protein vacuolar protein sorting-associated protein 39
LSDLFSQICVYCSLCSSSCLVDIETNSDCQVQLYLSEVLDWCKVLKEEQKWDEKELSPTRTKLISTLEVISDYNAKNLLKRLPSDSLFEERAILLGKINQHHLALSLYVHKVDKVEKCKD